MIAKRFDLIKIGRWRRSLRKSAYHQTEKCFSTTVQTHDLVSRFNGAPCLLRRVRVFLFRSGADEQIAFSAQRLFAKGHLLTTLTPRYLSPR